MATCERCGLEFEAGRGDRPRRFCSYSCRSKTYAYILVANRYDPTGKKQKSPRYGPNNPAWKGGITFKRNKGNYIGPKYVRCPADLLLMARADGYVMEHRLVMARWVRRPLTRTEVVHHLDHTTRNNQRPNLELWPDNQSHKAAEHGRCVLGAACRLSLMV